MDINNLRPKIRAFIFGIFILLFAIVLIRIFFTLIDANKSTPIVKFWFDTISYPFVVPLEGVYPNLFLGKMELESSAILSLIMILTFMLITHKIVMALIVKDSRELLFNIIDSLFKIIELLLILRFLFKITGAEDLGFINLVYFFSEFVYSPFKNILPHPEFGAHNQYIFETSTLIAIIVVTVFDIVSESILKSMFAKEKTNDINLEVVPEAQPLQSVQPVQQTSQPQTNITINVPQNPPGQLQESKQYLDVFNFNPEEQNPPKKLSDSSVDQVKDQNLRKDGAHYNPNAGPWQRND